MHHPQLWIAVALILVEAGVFAYLSETWTVPLCVSLLSVLSLLIEWRFPLNPYRRLVAALALAIPFTIQWAFTPYDPSHLRTFILYSLAHAGGQYGLALQTAYVWIKRPGDTWSAAFPVCGVCVLMAAGDVQTTHFQNIVFQVFVLVFIILTAAYYSWARIPLAENQTRRFSGRLVVSGIAISLTCLVSVIGSRMLERSWSTIERIYTEWMLSSGQQGTAGFSRQARLGSISDRAGPYDEVPVVRIYSKEEPGYLRGAAFDRYRNGNWTSDAIRKSVTPAFDAPAAIAKNSEFPLFRFPSTAVPDRHTGAAPRVASSWQVLEVWPTIAVSDAIFAPLEARWVSLPQQELMLDGYGIAYPENQLPETYHRTYVPAFSQDDFSPADPDTPASAKPIPESRSDSVAQSDSIDPALLMAVPDDLDPRVRDLAKTILADCVTPDQKVLAVSGWFRKNYHYELGIKVPAGQDPVTYFLTRRPAAHCEYFAAGTAILLRLGGVPCRYVTGFVATEYNYLGGYWLVRNKDAHAWVEALLPERGWVTVESTPPAGIPHSSHSIQPRHLWDDIVLRVQMLRSQLLQGTWHGLWRAFTIVFSMLLTTPHGWLMLCGCALWIMVLLRRHFHFTFRSRLDPVSPEFHRLLNELDRQLDRASLRRQSQETLHQFAARLTETSEPALCSAAEWYRDYADLRYRTEPYPEAFSTLRAKLPALIAELRQRAKQK
jgi:transglutaminase-like putative cysteine protease